MALEIPDSKRFFHALPATVIARLQATQDHRDLNPAYWGDARTGRPLMCLPYGGRWDVLRDATPAKHIPTAETAEGLDLTAASSS